MSLTSTVILERFRRGRPGDIDLTLRPAYRDLLKKLGDPQKKLPPVFHVAGTNGKGSTCAFLRAILEAAGYKVHVYTSPHLVQFHERIRIAGRMISEEELVAVLTECERAVSPGAITIFEALTASALAVFARNPADFVILETGLGGRLDATNIIEKPRATLISRISYDHREYLGNSLGDIAKEKAGIMRSSVPCFAAPQPDAESYDALHAAAATVGAPLFIGGRDWRVAAQPRGFRFTDARHTLDLPAPALLGVHQCWNAGLAIAALLNSSAAAIAAAASQVPILAPLEGQKAKNEDGFSDIVAAGLQGVEWPARLQKLDYGKLREALPRHGWELWLDGGHNDSAGEVLGLQMRTWQAASPRPLHLVLGMMKTKKPGEFLAPLVRHAASLRAVSIPNEQESYSATELSALAHAAGIENAAAAGDVEQALQAIAESKEPGRVLICGSLYLAGEVLRLNEGVAFKD